ncbi:oxidoreductase [Candidatus Saccharibacteria bacterium]|nr:oxidoreductase [Candidatus Saccharibacteria bacterium]
MKVIEKVLNNVTMYRLVLYVLAALTVLALIFSFQGRISASPTSLIVSLSLLVISAYGSDRAFGRLFHIPTNMESSLITALILFLIIDPAHTLMAGVALLLAGAISSASKFLLSLNGKHIFNPAALAAAVLSLTGLQAVTWWVGSSALWPFAFVLGLFVVLKIRRLPLLITFAVVSIGVQLLLFVHGHQPIFTGMRHALLASPLIFMATLMLTEPATMPPRRSLQIVFATIVALLYVSAPGRGPFIVYPEVALLIGNVFAYAVSPKFRVRLQLKEIQQISDRVYNYIFQPERPFKFLPGQYMEWTLAGVPYDSRGNRRTFTIASSPTESEVHLGLKYYEPASAYKMAFFGLKQGDTIYASQLAGDFTMKGNENKKLAFIAGGIGITPFRSMVKCLTDKNTQSDIILIYIVGDPKEFVYVKQLREALPVGIKTKLVVTNLQYLSANVITAKVNAELLNKLIPDHTERTFYISGPNVMVDATKGYLQQLHVSNNKIKTDHFSGY